MSVHGMSLQHVTRPLGEMPAPVSPASARLRSASRRFPLSPFHSKATAANELSGSWGSTSRGVGQVIIAVGVATPPEHASRVPQANLSDLSRLSYLRLRSFIMSIGFIVAIFFFTVAIGLPLSRRGSPPRHRGGSRDAKGGLVLFAPPKSAHCCCRCRCRPRVAP